MSNTIKFPWPPKELSPNARVHWAVKAAKVKLYRSHYYYLTKQSGIKVNDNPIELFITFNPPDKRKRDMDNCLASIKSGLDGLAEALKVNDRNFVLHLKMSDSFDGSVDIAIKDY